MRLPFWVCTEVAKAAQNLDGPYVVLPAPITRNRTAKEISAIIYLFLGFQFELDKQGHVLEVSCNFRVQRQDMHLGH